MSKKNQQTESLTFQFENVEAAEHFKSWFCDQGEEDYWASMSEIENEEDGDITGLEFDYWSGDLILVKCGRFSDAVEIDVEE